MFTLLILRAALVVVSLLSIPISAHTWVEQLNVIAPNGTIIDPPGFPRGNVKRSNPAFSDTAMTNLIPANGGTVNVIEPSQLMCKQSQTQQTQTGDSPRLSASPGASVALRYQENGHVTLPATQAGKPSNRGTNFVYYTTQSHADDKFLNIHRQWTADGTGGDGRGQLISTQNFDDGQCYQVNGQAISTQRQTEFKHVSNQLMGADLWCQQDIQIPATAKPGSTVTLYWVWDWPTMPGAPGFPEGKQEFYTTCMDINIVASTGSSKAVAQKFAQQDFGNAAASSQFADIANPTAVISPAAIPFSKVAGSGSESVSRATTLVASSVQSSVVSQITGVSSTSSARPRSRPSSPPSQQGAGGATVTLYQTGFVTVTSLKTVTASSATQTAALVVTVVESDTITMTMTNTVNAKRQVRVTSTEPAVPSTTSLACSRTENAFRLRARNPFYILPSQDRPGAGC